MSERVQGNRKGGGGEASNCIKENMLEYVEVPRGTMIIHLNFQAHMREKNITQTLSDFNML